MTEPKELKEEIDIGFASIRLIKPAIICVTYLTEDVIDSEKGVQILNAITSLAGSKVFCTIINRSNLYTPCTEHFKFMISQRSPEKDNLLARAIVTTNMASRIEAQNFVNFFKPLTPTKLFPTLEEAITWLEPQLSKVNK
jgi:hypothetical protein